jgi:biotin carboxyl carrier protein
MEYRLIINEETSSADVSIIDNDTVNIAICDARYRVGYARISENQLHLNINGDTINAYIADAPDGAHVVIEGMTYIVQEADAPSRHKKRKKGLSAIPQEITPPMPSVVVRILVGVGDVVAKGSGVVVVSAMKMETTLLAPFDGTVTAIHVAVGDKVMPGQILVDIKKNEDRPQG